MADSTPSLKNWDARCRDRYRDALARGLHDDSCEQRERSSLCHCSKRRREARGLTEVPPDDLYFPPPSCPVCDGDLDHDGDGWRCHEDALAWSSDGQTCEGFQDDYGPEIATEKYERFGRRLIEIEGGGS